MLTQKRAEARLHMQRKRRCLVSLYKPRFYGADASE